MSDFSTEERQDEIAQDILKKKDEWCANVLEEQLQDSDIAEKFRDQSDLSSIRRELIDNGIFLFNEGGDGHSFLIQIEHSDDSEEPVKQQTFSVVDEYKKNTKVNTSSLIEDDRVTVLGEFEVGVWTYDENGGANPTVRYSKNGRIDQYEPEEQG